MPDLNVLLAATGSVAAMKIPTIINKLKEISDSGDNDYRLKIKLIYTEHSKHFFDPTNLPIDVAVHSDDDEWSMWRGRGDQVLHIELGRWADVMVIAPLDANTLAKISHGICDNLLTCTVRAWDLKKPLIYCPAMNTRMWEHPLTKHQLDILNSFGYIYVDVIVKTLICGDHGTGAMAEPQTIVDIILKYAVPRSVEN